MINEIWIDIVGYEQLYQISNLGRVKSLNYNKTGKEKILKLCKNNSGYLLVNLSKNSETKKYTVHRLVAEAFIDNPNNLPCIDHINCEKSANSVENLRWVTHKENMNNPITKLVLKNNGLKNNKGQKIATICATFKNSKPIIQFSKDGEFIRKWNCIMDVERELGIDQGNISKCCNGKLKSAGGYKWSYAN